MRTDWPAIEELIRQHCGTSFRIQQRELVTGGCINECWRLTSGTLDLFIKLNQANKLPMFQAEVVALQILAQSQTITVPTPILTGKTEQQAFLLLNYLQLNNHGDQSKLGQQLALLHQQQQSSFGFSQNNFIGSTPQSNHINSNWPHFWQTQRLQPQLTLGQQNGWGNQLLDLGAQLLEHLPNLISHPAKASLLHGDLWSGNTAFLAKDTPCIFDPASYYGDHECDLAMSELFGGFNTEFYRAYQRILPIQKGYDQRKHVYNLYHILNHANLFGGGYLQQAKKIMHALLPKKQ